MKINVKISSESASKKAQTNAKILFGTKGATILDKLKVLSKEKLLVTPDLTSLLSIVEKSSDTEALTKVSKSSVGKNLAKNAKALASAKTMPATLKALKALKAPKALLNLGTVSSPGKSSTGQEVFERFARDPGPANADAIGTIVENAHLDPDDMTSLRSMTMSLKNNLNIVLPPRVAKVVFNKYFNIQYTDRSNVKSKTSAPKFNSLKPLPFLKHLFQIMLDRGVLSTSDAELSRRPVDHIYMEYSSVSVRDLTTLLRPLGAKMITSSNPIYKVLIQQAMDAGLDVGSTKSFNKKFFNELMDSNGRPVHALFLFPGNQVLALASVEEPVICAVQDLFKFGN